jgi:hypothetical protein
MRAKLPERTRKWADHDDNEDAVITVGGADDREPAQSEPAASRPKGPVLGLAGLVVGLVMGSVFAGGGTEPATTTTTLPEEVVSPSVSITTTTTSPPRPSRLATRAPGLSDNLVVTAVDSTGVTEVKVWEPPDIAPGPSTLPVARFFAADVSHQWLGAFADSRYQELGNLWVGNSQYLETIALDVTGFVWHSRLPARIAYTAGRDARTLWTAQLPNAEPTRIAEIGQGEIPVWFNQSGIVLFDEATLTLRLVDDTGETVTTVESVRPIAGSPDVLAGIAEEDGSERAVVLDRTLAEISEAPWNPSCEIGSFSPSLGAAAAFLCQTPIGQVLQVWGSGVPLGTEPPGPDSFELLVEIPATGFHPPAWDSVGRMVIATDVDPIRPNTQIIVYDTLTDNSHFLDYAGSVIQVEVVVP